MEDNSSKLFISQTKYVAESTPSPSWNELNTEAKMEHLKAEVGGLAEKTKLIREEYLEEFLELETSVDHIIEENDKVKKLIEENEALKQRVTVLEGLVRQLISTACQTPSSTTESSSTGHPFHSPGIRRY
jgi:hypothetical protein